MKKMISALLSIIILCATAGKVSAQGGGDKNIAFVPAKNHTAFVSFLLSTSPNDKSRCLCCRYFS